MGELTQLVQYEDDEDKATDGESQEHSLRGRQELVKISSYREPHDRSTSHGDTYDPMSHLRGELHDRSLSRGDVHDRSASRGDVHDRSASRGDTNDRSASRSDAHDRLHSR